MKTKQEIEKIADAYIDNMDSHSFWDSFISGYETCQKDYEAKVIEKLDLTPTGQSYFDNQRAEHKRIIEKGRKLMNNNAETQQSVIQLVSGSLQDIQEIIEFLQWAFRKVDKGDTPEETVRMLLMNRAKIDKIEFDSITTNGTCV